MATDYVSHIYEGPIGGEAIVISYRADEANILIFGPVVTKDPASTAYFLPEVGMTDTAHDAEVEGVAVGPLFDAENGYCNDAAGQMVNVCVFGWCKLKVDGNSDNIGSGDAIATHNADGYGQQADITFPTTYSKTTVETQVKHLAACFARAGRASTADGDEIPVFVYGGAVGTIS
jgi:hypothetical protein